jgi:hypothetical protein
LLAEALSCWDGRDWRQTEEEIVRTALTGCRFFHWRGAAEQWWLHLPENLPEVMEGLNETINGQWLMVNG